MFCVGVVLLNLGGLECIQDVGLFFYNLFVDLEIIWFFSLVFQKLLVWLISILCSGKLQEVYCFIGGGLLLWCIIEQQVCEFQSLLCQCGIDVISYVVMCYWYLFIEFVVVDIKVDGMDEVVVFFFYFYFLISISGFSFCELQCLCQVDLVFEKLLICCICSWFDYLGYVKVMVELIVVEVCNSDDFMKVYVFFSVYGVLKSYVEEVGDFYQKEIEICIGLIMKELVVQVGYENFFILVY